MSDIQTPQMPYDTGDAEMVSVGLSTEITRALDAYAAVQADPKPSRAETIRKILEDRLVHENLIAPGTGIGT